LTVARRRVDHPVAHDPGRRANSGNTNRGGAFRFQPSDDPRTASIRATSQQNECRSSIAGNSSVYAPARLVRAELIAVP